MLGFKGIIYFFLVSTLFIASESKKLRTKHQKLINDVKQVGVQAKNKINENLQDNQQNLNLLRQNSP